VTGIGAPAGRAGAGARRSNCRRSDSLGGADYYAYFRRQDGSWTEPIHLGPTVNSPANDEYSINLSPDGKVVFFGSDKVLPRLDGHPLR